MNNNIIQRLADIRPGCSGDKAPAPVERAAPLDVRYSPPSVFPSLQVECQLVRRTDADHRP